MAYPDENDQNQADGERTNIRTHGGDGAGRDIGKTELAYAAAQRLKDAFSTRPQPSRKV